MKQISDSSVLVVDTCCVCGIRFAVPELYQDKLRETHKTFYCPNGHSLHFPSASKIEQAERAAKEWEKEAHSQQLLKEAAERSARAHKAAHTRTKNRVKNGVCPCCKRHFANLGQHMLNKHPNYAEET